MNEAKSSAVTITRETLETKISVTLDIYRGPTVDISTGIGFFDHILTTLAYHAGWNLSFKASGDLIVDDHHTVEDCALVIGQALDKSLGDRKGLARFGYAYAPLDESLARAVIDLATRPYAAVELGLRREMIGNLACENVVHFLQTLSGAGRFTLHLDVIRGVNDHHRIESAFKALALAFRQAIQPRTDAELGTTKGVL